MNAPLTGTVALVTGASSGIGAAIARGLAADGAAVALVARRVDRLKSLADELPLALAVGADVTDATQAANAVARAATEWGRLDIVVNNAGLMLAGPVADAPDGEWERMLSVNLNGTLNIVRAALPHLRRAGTIGPRDVADLVTISSTSGRLARSGNAVYSLTKFGVNGFSEALRQEMVPHRVRVGEVAPGIVDTEMATHTRDGVREAFLGQVAEVTLMQPSDIADAVRYMVTRGRRVAVNEMLVRAAEQTW